MIAGVTTSVVFRTSATPDVALAEEIAGKLRWAARMGAENALAPGGRKADAKDVSNLADRMDVERAYWGALQNPFFAHLAALAEDAHRSPEAFARACRDVALSALRRAAEFQGDALVVECERDATIPHAVVENYLEALGGARTREHVVLRGADHGLHDPAHRREYEALLVRWFMERVGEPGPPQVS